MKTFIVRGEYGHQEGDFVEVTMRAQTIENAIKNFKARIRKGQYGYVKINDSNIYAEETKGITL